MKKSVSTKNLHKAKSEKNDEFYTQLSDINNELKNYKSHFAGKVVYCNCDNPEWSNFWKYFKTQFNVLGLKALISTHFNPSGQSYKLEFSNGVETKTMLAGNGDFRSPECVEILQEVDIVVTNPPFSLFREYVAQMVEHGKQFLIIGSQNAIAYKLIFSLIKGNKLWLGVNCIKEFLQPDGDVKKFGNISWFTNLTHSKYNAFIELTAKYEGNESMYPKYYNYDAINVDKVKDIPFDYDGYMGVPITFMDKFNPEQFEIVGYGKSTLGLEIGVRPYTDEHKAYRRNVQKRGAADGDLYMVKGDEVIVPYARIIIKFK